MPQNNSSSISPAQSVPGGNFESGSILDHLDKLEPSKGGKYICPVCGGNDLAIATKGRNAGAVTCYNNGCTWKEIMDAIAPLPKGQNGHKPKSPPRKTRKQKDHDAIEAEVLIDAKVTETLWQIESQSTTVAAGQLALSTWAKEHGHNSYAVVNLLKEKLKTLKEVTGFDDDEAPPALLRDYKKIASAFGDRLKYNLLFKQVELDAKPFDPSIAKIEFVVDHRLKLKAGRDEVADCVIKLAKQNEYHPVRNYLDTVHKNHGKESRILHNFAHQVLGTADPLHQTMVCKFLIAAVARAFNPGCQVDTALILQGGQGIGKSTFFRVLASPAWFDDSFGNASDKDERLKLHSAWILEWAELETIFKRKDVAAVKAFMTTKIDRIRPPYGRSIEFMPRSSIFCGTTNETEFLSDSTGNRRFWVVPVTKAIDAAWMESKRDEIWAAAVGLYFDGVPWWLSADEERAIAATRSQYESTDPWHEEVEDWIEGRECVSVQEILTNCLSIDLHNHDKRSQMRIHGILKRCNWYQVPNAVFYNGKRVRIWTPSKDF